MLESNYSTAATVVAQAMPFPVDFKETSEDALFKQVTFPGEEGTYRVRVVNVGDKTVSAAQIKAVHTQIPADHLDGQRFRVKSVLSQPVLGVDESYWLTLKHQDYGEVQNHNQYRVRGVTTTHLQSEWMYSEAREADNRLKIFELIHDVLDIAMMLHDDELQTFLETTIQDAFKAMTLGEDAPFPSYTFAPTEPVEHSLQEGFQAETSHLSTFNETLMATLQDTIKMMTGALYHEFKESFSTGARESSELTRMYKLGDAYEHEPIDFVHIVIEKFLEDRLDKIVESSNLEVLLDNGENKELYLEGTYNLDIKGEILHAAMSLMPTDRFVFNVKSTVKLLTDKVVLEQEDYSILEQTRETLHALKQDFHELLQVYPSEEVVKHLRFINQDVFMPFLVVDQRFADISFDVFDQLDHIEADDMVVEYQLANNDQTTRYLMIKDLADDLIWGDAPTELLYQQDIKDVFMGLLTDKRCMQIDKDLIEVLEVFADMGECVRAHATNIPVHTMEQEAIRWSDQLEVHTKRQQYEQEEFLAQLIDLAAAKPIHSPYSNAERIQINIKESSQSRLGLREYLHDYQQCIAWDTIKLNPALKWKWGEVKQVFMQDDVNPIYQPHIKDHFARTLKEEKEIAMQHALQDKFELNGTENVSYALGDISMTGWPVGVFRLGINTLKGVT